MSPDYSRPEYGHDAKLLQSIRALQAMPLWARRKQCRNWYSWKLPFTYRFHDFNEADTLSVKKVTDLLVHSRLYLAAPSDFNDPYDFRANISLADDVVARRKDFQGTARSVLKNNPNIVPHKIKGRRRKIEWLTRRAMAKSIQSPDAVKDAFERTRDRNGVACFCLDPRNLLMWSLYAAGHTGICLQFDITRDPGVLALVHPVNYEEEIARLRWPEEKDRIVEDVILRKNRIWQHEKEVRYVSITTVRDSIDFDGSAVTGVILGARFPPSGYALLRGMLVERSSNNLPMPRLFRARQKMDTYGVALERFTLP